MIFLLEKKLYIYRIFLKSPYLTYFWKFWYETVVIATDITLYLLTELGAPKVIKYNALVSFYYEVSLGSFWGWNMHFFTQQETWRMIQLFVTPI